MKNSGICICTLLGGAIIGSVVTMLFAPKTGKEIRETIRDFVDGELERVKCRCNEEAHNADNKVQRL